MINEDKKEKMTPSSLVGEGRGDGLKQQTLSRICKLAFGSLTNSTPVLKLLHAHRVSPKLLRNRRLNLFAIRINSLSLNHPSAISLSQGERVCGKLAFTLAEVLITLGIIGIVAAMTMPALITKYEKKRTATAVKKVYSELTQVIQRAEVDYGEFKYWDMNDDSLEGRRLFVNKYIKPYYKGYNMLSDGNSVDLWDNNSVSGAGINGILPNGTVISIAVVSNDLYVLVDVNGFSRPNKMGRDIFYFNTLTGKLMPSGWQSNLTREMALNGYVPEKEGGLKYSCKRAKTNDDDNYTDVKHACTALLMLDGWEFKDDYPW